MPFPREAMILAAGLGERLAPVTELLPKPLLPLANVPIIERLIRKLQPLGVEKVIVNLHHLGDKIHNHLGDGSRFGLQLIYSLEEKLLGTAGGIAKMLPSIEGNHFICMNGDFLQLANLQKAWQAFQHSRSAATMILTSQLEEQQESAIGFVASPSSDDFGRIVSLLDYSSPTTTTSMGNFTGTHFFNRNFLADFFRQNPHSYCIIREGYLNWLQQAEPISAYIEAAPLLDIGTKERYLAANRAVLEREAPEQTASVEATIVPPVVIGKDVQIDSSAKIGPFVSIGDCSTIKANATVANSILLPGASIEAGESLLDKIVTSHL